MNKFYIFCFIICLQLIYMTLKKGSSSGIFEANYHESSLKWFAEKQFYSKHGRLISFLRNHICNEVQHFFLFTIKHFIFDQSSILVFHFKKAAMSQNMVQYKLFLSPNDSENLLFVSCYCLKYCSLKTLTKSLFL